MQKLACFLAICLANTLAFRYERIAGGSLAGTNSHPYAAVVLFSANAVTFRQDCGGTVINNRSVLTAASCLSNRTISQIRTRVGSVNASSGGTLHNTGLLITHPLYDTWNQDSNIGLIRATTVFPFGNAVSPASIAGSTFVVPDFADVLAIGWGQMSAGGASTEQLRQVMIRTVGRERCESMYGVSFVTDNMICAGWEMGGRGSCAGDYGSPLLQNNVAVGITSFGYGCGDARFPSLYTKISQFTNWIQINA